jgi:hypothetical protein
MTLRWERGRGTFEKMADQFTIAIIKTSTFDQGFENTVTLEPREKRLQEAFNIFLKNLSSIWII